MAFPVGALPRARAAVAAGQGFAAAAAGQGVAAAAAGQGVAAAAAGQGGAAVAGRGVATAVAVTSQVTMATRKIAAIQAVWSTQLFPLELIRIIVQYAAEEQFKGRKITLTNHGTFGAVASASQGRQAVCYYEGTMPFYPGVGPIQFQGQLPILGGPVSEHLALVDLETGVISSWQTQRQRDFRVPHALVSTENRFWFTEGSTLHSCTHRQMVPSQPQAIPAMPLAEVDRVGTMIYDPLFSRLIFTSATGALITFDLNTTTFKTIPCPKNLEYIHFIATTAIGVVVISRQSITHFTPDFVSVLFDESLVESEDMADYEDEDDAVTTFGVASYDPSIDRLYVANRSIDGAAIVQYSLSPPAYHGVQGVAGPVIALASFQGGWVYVTQNATNSRQTMRYQHQTRGVFCQQRLVGDDRLQVDLYSPLLNNNLVLGPRFISVLATKAFQNLHLYEVVPGVAETAASPSPAPHPSQLANAHGGVATFRAPLVAMPNSKK